MPLPDLLPIQPFTRPVRGKVTLPGSKSITNRALLLAALCDGPVTLTGALFSEDTEIMAEALRQLGFVVKEDAEKKTIYVEGRGGKIPKESATLHVGLAGTAARFLTALCAAAPSGVFKIDGVAQMRKRPMKGLFDALTSLGARINYLDQPGFFPVEIHASGFRETTCVKIAASESSQMLSALLMVAPLSPKGVVIEPLDRVRQPFVEMTQLMMKEFGIPIHPVPHGQNTYEIPKWNYQLRRNSSDKIVTYQIEPDATAASYFIALPLVTTGELSLPAFRNTDARLQGDTKFLNVLERVGVSAQSTPQQTTIKSAATRHSVSENFEEFSDTFLTLAAIAPLLDGPTKITGIAHTRKQETDRVAGMARELKKLGQEVIENEDSLEIHPRPLTPGITIETYGDHRFAMSFAILGCYDLLGNGQPWLTIKNPACCAKTFPNFFDVLNELRTNSHLSQ
ncbi:MAG: 3-phosphoshikimate 1-carboxyvinyltransferase [Verrucomicrobia bacterium]|nr:3-phosphoshikimate 1-carboxyvinyltransferase [Verrucomicrobiota bacterium]